MYYGMYQAVRDSAWRCLLDFGIDRLPVDVRSMARQMGIRVVRNSEVGDLLPNENGKAYFDGTNWLIIYNDNNPTELSRFTLAHELGHILLGHEMAYIRYAQVSEFTVKPKAEQQADTFALRLLCPACVLWELGLTAPQEIANACHVSIERAEQRAARLWRLAERDRFFTSSLERQVRDRFAAYISQTRGKLYGE